jgi:cytidyltransferase-like protein
MELGKNKVKHGLMGSEPTTRVWLNGTFDVLHYGHIHLFQHAKNLYPNTIVRVGLDTDERIGQMKGSDRPINTLDLRTKFLQSIRYIDEVVTFGTDDELREQIRAYNPHIMVIGDDYRERTIIGEEHVDRVVYVERYGGLSSTKILNGG